MNHFSKCLLVARFTFKELMKSRILYGTAILAIAQVLVTFVATEFTYGVPEKVALDIGLGMLSLSSLGIALFMGVTLLSKEIETRTVYMVISRPVPRWAFILGKLLGLFSVLVINVLALSIVTLGSSYLLGGTLDNVILISVFFNVLESLLLLLLVVFFSLFANNILASFFALTLLVLGHSVQETQGIGFVANRPYIKKILEFYHLVLPGFYKLNFKEFVVYRQSLETEYILNSFLYGASYSAFLFVMILYCFQRKNLD